VFLSVIVLRRQWGGPGPIGAVITWETYQWSILGPPHTVISQATPMVGSLRRTRRRCIRRKCHDHLTVLFRYLLADKKPYKNPTSHSRTLTGPKKTGKIWRHEINKFKLLAKHYPLSLPKGFQKSSSIYWGSESNNVAMLNVRLFYFAGTIFPIPKPAKSFYRYNKAARKRGSEMSSFVYEGYSIKHDKKICIDFFPSRNSI
jgi:hypothetical protein